jgi:hypothetical protein
MSQYYRCGILIVGGAMSRIRKGCSINASSFSDWCMIGGGFRIFFSSSFFNALYSFRMGQGGEDKCCWIPLKSDILRSKLFTNFYFPMLAPHSSGRAFKGQMIL